MESCIHREVYVQFGERTARIAIIYIVCGAFLLHHNRGASGYFGFVKDLEIGDKMTYTTRYGVRNYKIVSKIRINDTDYTSLGWTDKNTLTLITCVENKPSLRWSVQAEEIK